MHYIANIYRSSVSTSSTNIPDYAPREQATKLGNKVTYGPFTDIPSFRDGAVVQGLVRFEHPLPVLSVVELERVAEISHWAGNLAVEDRAWVRNDGPELEGHFSRIDYQASSFRGQRSPSTLVQVRVPLPPGAKDAYVVDAIGNVSTSRFAPVPPNPKIIARPVQTLSPHQASVLDLQPRYPLLGGWNYTFSYGFNLDVHAGGFGKVLEAGRFSIAVPFLTPIAGGTAYDDVTLKIVLPEGAEDIQVFVPFDVDDQAATVTKTYLDTTGRKTVVLKKKNCTEQNSQLVYVCPAALPVTADQSRTNTLHSLLSFRYNTLSPPSPRSKSRWPWLPLRRWFSSSPPFCGASTFASSPLLYPSTRTRVFKIGVHCVSMSVLKERRCGRK